MDSAVKSLAGWLAVLMLVGLTACTVAPLSPAPTASVLPPTPAVSPPAPPVTAYPALPTPAPDRNRIAATINLSNPASMAVGGGHLWIVSGGSIVRIDPKANRVVGQPLTAGATTEGAIAYGEGALWVSHIGSGDLGAPNDADAVSRINPESGQLVATLKVSRGPLSLALTPGIVWVTNFGMSGDSVTRIDTQTNQIKGDPLKTGRAPIDLAIGDGSLWVANHDARTVTRLDAATHQIVAHIPVPSEPHRIAFGAGAVWVANWHDNSLSRIDPQTNRVVGAPIAIGHRAGNLAAGPEGVWVTSDYRVDGDPKDTVVVHIDPRSNQVVETIPVGGHPMDVALAGDAAWVSVQNPDVVLRINPRQ